MKQSAFGNEYYPPETAQKAPKFDARTKYELLQCSFVEENLIKHPTMHVVRAVKMPNLLNETWTDYCLLITSNLYTITAIKTKVDCLPDNNNFMPATYRCSILNKQCKVIERLGQIASKNIFNLFANGKFK